MSDNFEVCCEVCGWPIELEDEPHFGHNDGCPETEPNGCSCDVVYHPACCPECVLVDTVAIILDRDLATKMVRPWYLIKKREADIVRAAIQTALDNNGGNGA
jgi:hypothetical protein